MALFEFVVEGPPKTANAKNRSRYNHWVDEVNAAARLVWPPGQAALSDTIFEVRVVNYYRVTKERPIPPDVDNVLKPILDALKGLVYVDDLQVFRVVSERYDLALPLPTPETPVVAAGRARYRQFLVISAFW